MRYWNFRKKTNKRFDEKIIREVHKFLKQNSCKTETRTETSDVTYHNNYAKR